MAILPEASRYLIYTLWLFVTVSSTMAGEYCTYTSWDTGHYQHRTRYCSGYCCDKTAERCCDNDSSFNWILILGIAGGVIFVVVIIVLIAALCKRSNLKRARVRDNQPRDEMEMTLRFPQTGRQPNIYFVDPPSHSPWNTSPGMREEQPPWSQGPTRQGGDEGVQEGGSRGGAYGEFRDDSLPPYTPHNPEKPWTAYPPPSYTFK